MMSRKIFCRVLSIFVFTAQPAFAIDWTQVPGKDITLFYPAQMSWELLLTQSEHSGAGKFRDGKNCRGCHDNEEQSSGKLLVADKTIEPAPIAGKPGFIKAKVKAAHDADNIYIHIDFDPGRQPDAGMDKDFATKIAVMIDDGGVAEMARAGCWAACHDNAASMPSGGGSETTKYLARSRTTLTRKGGDALKPADDLAKFRADGGYLEYWQAKLNSGAPAQAVDGTILEKRQEHAKPLVSVDASDNNGVWAVTFTRKLMADGEHKAFVPGKTYVLGFSVHAGHTVRRFHYVSLEKTLALDSGKADFVAQGF